MRLAGFVLVGGNSARMGRDKARLPIESHLLIEDVAAKVACITKNVALIGGADRYTELPFENFPDLRTGKGPLAGVEAALSTNRGDLNLIVACDMPGLHVAWLGKLAARALETKSSCIICEDEQGVVHPLCGLWKLAALPVVEAALDRGQLRMSDLLQELCAERVQIDSIIRNVNTPEEWETWQIAHGRPTVQLS